MGRFLKLLQRIKLKYIVLSENEKPFKVNVFDLFFCFIHTTLAMTQVYMIKCGRISFPEMKLLCNC